MAHKQQQEWIARVKAQFPDHFQRVRALDCGSLDINGSNKYLFNQESGYTGIDLQPGKNVNRIIAAEDADWPDGHFHTILSSEMLEHAKHWDKALRNIVRMLRPGGLLAISCATTGRPEHDTDSWEPESSPFTRDYYRNLTEQDIRAALDLSAFAKYRFETNQESYDLYFWGIKKGVLIHGCTCEISPFNPVQLPWNPPPSK